MGFEQSSQGLSASNARPGAGPSTTGLDAGSEASEAAAGPSVASDTPALDAGTVAPNRPAPEAGIRDAQMPPAPSGDGGVANPCSGVALYDVCWYLTPLGESCQGFCSDHGGYDPRTARYLGTSSQGGSPSACGEILVALGTIEPVIEGYRTDGLGLGCHVWDDGTTWWLFDPAFDPTSSAGPAQLVCGCLQ